MDKTTVAIIGYGWVGKAMYQLFPDAYIYDPALNMGKKKVVNKCDIAFICVPTPCPNEKALDTSIVEKVVKWCKCPLLVIRSTVNPGTCDHLTKKYHKHIVFQPEYLGESIAHPLVDMKSRPFIILGGNPEDRHTVLELYFTRVYNANTSVRQLTNLEAEVIKLSENRAIACKIAEVQELIDICKLAKVDYYNVRDAVYHDDFRFNLWWTADHGSKKGFNSKCLPKDVFAWCAWAESLGYNPRITREILNKNKEWINTI